MVSRQGWIPANDCENYGVEEGYIEAEGKHEKGERSIMARTVDNNGIGALYGTFDIDTTTGDYDLTADDEGCAVALSASNEADKGSDGGILLGRLENVKDGIATVQIAGVVRLDVDTGETAPDVGNRVVINGVGKVYQAPALAADDPAGGNVARGLVIAVDSTNHTCDVLL